MHRVMIHPSDYNNVSQAVKRAFDLFPIQVKGKKVLVKPNVLRKSDAAEGIVTHPSLLRSVVEHVEKMEPSSLSVGDNPGLYSYGDNEESFRKTGLMAASKGYYQNIGNESVKVEFSKDFVPAVSLSHAVLDADIIIISGINKQ